jgi:hypothetical protein
MPGGDRCPAGGPGQASAAHDRTSGLPGLPGGPVARELSAGDGGGDAAAALFVRGVPVQPTRMAQVNVAKVSVGNNV